MTENVLKKVEKLVNRLVTPRSLAYFLTAVYIVTLIPILAIGHYNVPSADDFSIGVTCRDAWLSTHSVFQVLWQAVLMAWNDYFHWMGYFTSIFLMSIHPGVFGESVYALTTWLMIGSVSFGTLYLMRAILVKMFGMNKYICHSISILLLFVTIQCTVGRCEAFFWYCGAVNYTFIHGLSLLFFGAVISMIFDKSRRKQRFDMVIACILGFLVGGGNYMTSLNVCIIIGATVCLLLWNKKMKEYRKLLLPFGFAVLGFLLSCLAPGNNVRAAGATSMSALKAIGMSFYYCLDYCLSDWTSWVVLLLVLICIPLFWKGLEHTDFRFPCPLLFAGFSFGVLSAMMTPPLFAVGNIEAGRLQALVFIMYILILTLNTGYIVGWVRYRTFHDAQVMAVNANAEKTATVNTVVSKAGASERSFSANTSLAVLTAIIFLAFGSVLCIIPDAHYYTFTSAITDLANGNAKAFRDTMEGRFVILRDESVKDAVLEPLPVEPKLLYYSDISTDPEYWENGCMAKGYHKNSVVKRAKE